MSEEMISIKKINAEKCVSIWNAIAEHQQSCKSVNCHVDTVVSEMVQKPIWKKQEQGEIQMSEPQEYEEACYEQGHSCNLTYDLERGGMKCIDCDTHYPRKEEA